MTALQGYRCRYCCWYWHGRFAAAAVARSRRHPATALQPAVCPKFCKCKLALTRRRGHQAQGQETRRWLWGGNTSTTPGKAHARQSRQGRKAGSTSRLGGWEAARACAHPGYHRRAVWTSQSASTCLPLPAFPSARTAPTLSHPHPRCLALHPLCTIHAAVCCCARVVRVQGRALTNGSYLFLESTASQRPHHTLLFALLHATFTYIHTPPCLIGMVPDGLDM